MLELKQFVEIFPYFITGFISLKIWELINPIKEKKASEIIFESLTYGMIYKKGLDYLGNIFIIINDKNCNLKNIILIILVIVTPIILKKILKSQFGQNKIVKTIDPSSWDYFFSKRESCIVVVYLKDTKKPIVGLYSGESFASSFPNKRDIYLEKMYFLNKKTGKIKIKNDSKGVYIPEENIKYIEFVNE